MQKLCIIPCGKKKIWDIDPSKGATLAKDAYVGVFHKLCKAYADKFFDHWIIISAKHGLLLPKDVVPGNYDLTFHQRNAKVITVDELKQQLLEKGFNDVQEIVVLTGKKYQSIIYHTFTQVQSIEFPLLGTSGIGEMQKILKESVQLNQPIHKRSMKQ